MKYEKIGKRGPNARASGALKRAFRKQRYEVIHRRIEGEDIFSKKVIPGSLSLKEFARAKADEQGTFLSDAAEGWFSRKAGLDID